jgi:predicted phage-related endonuclease
MNAESDMTICRINRDREIESMIFIKLDEFVESLRLNKPPDMSGVNPELALKALARAYGGSKPDLPTIQFGKKQERGLRRIAELQAVNTELERKVRENEREVTAISVKIAEIMGSHEHGVLETAADKLLVSYITKSSRRVDSDLLKKNHPDIYSTSLKTTYNRKLKLEVQPV